MKIVAAHIDPFEYFVTLFMGRAIRVALIWERYGSNIHAKSVGNMRSRGLNALKSQKTNVM